MNKQAVYGVNRNKRRAVCQHAATLPHIYHLPGMWRVEALRAQEQSLEEEGTLLQLNPKLINSQTKLRL